MSGSSVKIQLPRSKVNEEHGNLLKRVFPKLSTDFCQIPPRFEFEASRIHSIEGFPLDIDTALAGTTNPEWVWKKVGAGFVWDEKLFKTLTNTFGNTQGTWMLIGFRWRTCSRSCRRRCHMSINRRWKSFHPNWYVFSCQVRFCFNQHKPTKSTNLVLTL